MTIKLSNQELDKALNKGLHQLVANYLEQELADTCRHSFKHFVKTFWHIVSPTKLVENWYVDAICDHLQGLSDIKRLIISIPPRHGKSTLMLLYSAWLWIQQPHIKFLCSSYSLQLSKRDSMAAKSVILSPLYQRLFGASFALSADNNTQTRYHNNKLGFRLATSTHSGNTGEGCDVLLVDDPNDAAKINSQAHRMEVINWWCQVMATRMNPTGANHKVIIQQRLHEQDLTGFVLATNNYTKLVLPYEYEPSRKTITPIFTDPRTEAHEPLSSLYTPEQIAEEKGAGGLGISGFATQFQQRPAAAEGNIFKTSWFKRYTKSETNFILGDKQTNNLRIFAVADLAISLKTTADYTVIQVWGLTPDKHLLLLYQYRNRIEGADIVKQFHIVNELYKPDAIYIEDVAYQRLMLQLCRQQNLPVKGLTTQGHDKKARSQRAQIMAECGSIWLPQDEEYVDTFLAEITTFPNSAFDDMFDCLAYAAIVSQKYGMITKAKDKTPAEKVADMRQLAKQKLTSQPDKKFMTAGL
jgi:predicted phage terminase large subunit-like protein